MPISNKHHGASSWGRWGYLHQRKTYGFTMDCMMYTFYTWDLWVRTRTSRWKSQGTTFGSSQEQTSYLSQVSWSALLWRQWDPIGWRPLRGDTERLLSSIHSNPEILRFKSRNSNYIHEDPTCNQQCHCPAFRRAASRERHGAWGETS